jgi:hypothetical protein
MFDLQTVRLADQPRHGSAKIVTGGANLWCASSRQGTVQSAITVLYVALSTRMAVGLPPTKRIPCKF